MNTKVLTIEAPPRPMDARRIEQSDHIAQPLQAAATFHKAGLESPKAPCSHFWNKNALVAPECPISSGVAEKGERILGNLKRIKPSPYWNGKVEMLKIPRGELELANTDIHDQRWHQARALELIHLVS